MESKRNEFIGDADKKQQFLVIITVALVLVFVFRNHAAVADGYPAHCLKLPRDYEKKC